MDTSDLKTPLAAHEEKTGNYFVELGYVVKCICPSNIPENKRPDFKIKGTEWESKAPEGKGKRTIKRNIDDALTQSENIIIDLRRCGLPDPIAINQLEFFFRNKRIKRLMVITKKDELLEYPENCLDK